MSEQGAVEGSGAVPAERTLSIEVAPVFRSLLGPAAYKGAYGGRAGAKSHFFADQVLVYAMREKCDIICLRETMLSLDQSVKKLLEIKIQAYGLGRYFNVLQSHIESKAGGRIGFQGMQNHTAESIKSLEGYKVGWFEEAHSCTQRSLQLLRPTFRREDSELWFSWNPNKPTDAVDKFFRGGPLPPKAVLVKSTFRDNPWLSQKSKDDMEYDRMRDPDEYAHVWLGEYWRRSSARIFKNWKVEEFIRPEGTIFRFGADWGFTQDPSCLVRCSIHENRLYIDYEAYQKGCEIVDLPTLFMSVPEAEAWPLVADSARPETISYMQKHGFPRILSAVKGKKSVEEGVAFLQSYDIVVHPRCKNVIDELSTYSFKIDPETDEVTNVIEDKNNHLMDALRYACEGVRRAKATSKTVTVTELMESGGGNGTWMG